MSKFEDKLKEVIREGTVSKAVVRRAEEIVNSKNLATFKNLGEGIVNDLMEEGFDEDAITAVIMDFLQIA